MNINVNDDTFRSLGLNLRESQIYSHLIKSTAQTVQQVSRATGINRTTAYRYIESLVKKNFAEWVIGERGNQIQATNAENWKIYLEQKKEKIAFIEKSLPDLISQIKLIKPSSKFETQIRYYHGEPGIKQMIWNTLQTKEPLRSYTVVNRREVIDPKFEDKFEVEWAKRNLKDKVITNETKIEYLMKKVVPLYKKSLNIRIIPTKKFDIKNEIAIYNNIFSIASLEMGNLVGVEIENPEIAKTQKSIFEIVWEVAKDLNKYNKK